MTVRLVAIDRDGVGVPVSGFELPFDRVFRQAGPVPADQDTVRRCTVTSSRSTPPRRRL